MSKDLEATFEEISSKLNALILLAIINSPQSMSLKEKIKILSQSGVTNQEISKILNKSTVHVAKEKSLMKKEGKNGTETI